jgi:predicted kinase
MKSQDPTGSGRARLIVFSGLPGAGKSSIARELAREIDAVYLRIDSIEEALRDSGAIGQPMSDAGYRVAYTLAEDNLRLGRTVVADCVNPIAVTRDAWREIAERVGVGVQEIEVRCSDQAEHRRRVEARKPDIPGLILPTWEEVLAREYHPWNRDRIEVDTARLTPAQILASIRRILNT